MSIDSIQSNTQTIGLSYHSPKFASSIVVLSCRRSEAASQRTIPFDQRIAPYSEVAGFLGVFQVGFMQMLLMDEELLTGSLRYNWKVICKNLLGIVPPDM
ncbi:serine/threonine-protein phosphatase 7 long form-like protein [Cucumis melo var. makuwa]|uniref:Serine/threonine-protein phosphatase 7 long form-like protein n=1 Tax=Cucumis melo var. makuwa TaxID=1194695 RepID=A0A5D3BZD1_CUCMM|nr:serine/threonine-protein phosphatase 7 long form-like protein [Cucumis melo var. makuwa]TYK05103.1 serine/threonine-protein phosphatase 7 long form-like protein [Cucumis melo var. makuwa]